MPSPIQHIPSQFNNQNLNPQATFDNGKCLIFSMNAPNSGSQYWAEIPQIRGKNNIVHDVRKSPARCESFWVWMGEKGECRRGWDGGEERDIARLKNLRLRSS